VGFEMYYEDVGDALFFLTSSGLINISPFFDDGTEEVSPPTTLAKACPVLL